jgi:hypothetical protein
MSISLPASAEIGAFIAGGNMRTITPGQDNFYHPTNEAEMTALIKQANEKGVKIRVHG